MILRKITQCFFFLSLFFSFFFVILQGSYHERNLSPKIAIFLSFSHPLLEDCSQSCIETLKSLDNFPEVIIVNAQDNIIKARRLARFLHKDNNIVAIVTLGTIATKIMSHIETQKPIVYAAVPDGETLSFPKNQLNAYGVHDNLDVNQYCFAIQTVTTNTQLVVYLKPPEPFPSNLQKEIVKKLHTSGIEVIEIPITSSTFKARIQQAIEKHPSAIFIPLSSLSHKEGTSFLQDILKAKIPIVTDDLSLVAEGACVACSVDYKKSGEQIAQLVHHLLYNCDNIETLRKILIDPLPQTTTFNEDVIKSLGVKLNKAERKQFFSITFKNKKSIEKSAEDKNTAAA
ncbi:ABC transporter substrate-binding protein [Candidatus Chlamydia sanziniae]|uniref:ABC transporter substrate-binding protein n=1 Tax=Candidatus Chlamydia sanziniae TaxID=1806891 RepID=UPI0018D28692|nr:ABC transporter substrate-binding protein [Candidatus Chlamydia sanziniae]